MVAPCPMEESTVIKNVYRGELEEAMRSIRKLVDDYPNVAMDTEFPGVVIRPVGDWNSAAEFQYQTLRTNVAALKMIQIGMTLFAPDGSKPSPHSTWQFNFKFSLTEDMHAHDSISLLHEAGIDFDTQETMGIEPDDFAELLISSGLVLSDKVTWIGFHCAYDFAYLLKMLTGKTFIPEEEKNFTELMKLYFPRVYDVKYLMKSCKNLKGGLQEVGDTLAIQRTGPQHQAGSDSLLTGDVFVKMRDIYFDQLIDDDKYLHHLYGLGASYEQLPHVPSTPSMIESDTPSEDTASGEVDEFLKKSMERDRDSNSQGSTSSVNLVDEGTGGLAGSAATTVAAATVAAPSAGSNSAGNSSAGSSSAGSSSAGSSSAGSNSASQNGAGGPVIMEVGPPASDEPAEASNLASDGDKPDGQARDDAEPPAGPDDTEQSA